MSKLKLAELYHSIKGEGLWTGIPMTFIRLAGCSVGKPLREDFVEKQPELAQLFSGRQDEKGLPILKFNRPAWLCHTYDGRPFWCDTEFGTQLERTAQEILRDVFEDRICLTGGEPLMHEEAVSQILSEARLRGKIVHIETSGTIFRAFTQGEVWVAVSPKLGCFDEMIVEADEVKLLVDQDFALDQVPEPVFDHELVWLQPINNELGLRRDNLELCLKLLRDFPHWRLSPQVHKLIGVR